jgi:hypothetical protein
VGSFFEPTRKVGFLLLANQEASRGSCSLGFPQHEAPRSPERKRTGERLPPRSRTFDRKRTDVAWVCGIDARGLDGATFAGDRIVASQRHKRLPREAAMATVPMQAHLHRKEE